MFKIAILLPKEYMLDQAREVSKNEEDISEIRYVDTADTITIAREIIENGAGIIIARGVQAYRIREMSDIPIAEIVLTGQELGLAITRAKKLVKKRKPKITIIGLQNMISDTTYFNEIYNVMLDMRLLDEEQKIKEETYKAIYEQTDVIIGGESVVKICNEMNVPSLFLESTKESIKNAIEVAKKMAYSAVIVKNHNTEFETILDASVQGIIKIDENKKITAINKMAQELTKVSENVIGTSVLSILKEVNESYLDTILEGKQDIYSTSLRVFESSTMLTIMPIRDDEKIYGAIATFYKMNISNGQDKNLSLSRLYIAKNKFSDIKIIHKEMAYCVEMAKMYALSSSPVLIYGEEGTQREVFAECIHNNSAYKSGPFISVNCGGMTEMKQLDMLFGNISVDETTITKGALEKGNKGTVFISEVDKLSYVCQYRLFRAIKDFMFIQNDIENSKTLDTRIIVTSSKRLDIAVKNGQFREDLYYAINGLLLTIPPIRERKEEIREFVNDKSHEFSKKYSKFIEVSLDAMDTIINYSWEGNNIQLESFCERLFLTTKKKLITADIVQFLLDELYPTIIEGEKETSIVVYKHPEAKKISELLEKHNGRRKDVAQEMNISTSTLWRKMKKYAVINEGDFHR